MLRNALRLLTPYGVRLTALPSVRADLLTKLGRLDEAHAEFERAASLTRNARERALLLERAAACARGSMGGKQAKACISASAATSVRSS